MCLSISQAQPSITALYFGLFVALVFIVCLNMFIGIVSRAFVEVHALFLFAHFISYRAVSPSLRSLIYRQVHEDVKTADLWKVSAASYESDLLRSLTRVLVRVRDWWKDKRQQRRTKGIIGGAATAREKRRNSSTGDDITDHEYEVRDACVWSPVFPLSISALVAGGVASPRVVDDVQTSPMYARSKAET